MAGVEKFLGNDRDLFRPGKRTLRRDCRISWSGEGTGRWQNQPNRRRKCAGLQYLGTDPAVGPGYGHECLADRCCSHRACPSGLGRAGERPAPRRAWQACAYMMGLIMYLIETRCRHPEKARRSERSSMQTLTDLRRPRGEGRLWPGTANFERSSAFDGQRRNSLAELRRIPAVSAMPMTRSSFHADKRFAALRSARRAQNASKELRNG